MLRHDRRISIVVPCYNRAAYLNIFLESLTWSEVSRDEFEVIVVNDGGVDHVELVADSWRHRGLDVHVATLRAEGPPRNNAVARNAGIRAARYPIVLQTDPDILFVSDVLQRVRDTLVPGTFCSVSGYYPLTRESTLDLAFGDEAPLASASAYLACARGRPNQVLSPDGVGGLHGAFACAKRDLERVGGYDETFAHWGWEDRELLVTLAHDGRLTRYYMEDTPVVHLWHPILRGETWRHELAARGLWSRVAWDVQMQRVSAEYPRSIRPRRRPSCVQNDSSDRRVFGADAYDAWETAEPLTPACSQRPLAYQLFFDAHRLEAAQLRALGHPSVARELLRYALERPWERSRLDSSSYENLDLAFEELAACDEEVGDVRARDVTLLSLSRLPGGPASASALRARSALRRGNLGCANREAQHLRGEAWTARRAALAIEIAFLSGDLETARRITTARDEPGDVAGDYFERLRLESYCRLIGRLASGEPATSVSHLDEERSEFLYSAAMRSVTAGLDLAACLLFDRFLRGRSPAEARLYEEGRRHLAAARERIVGKVEPGWASTILMSLEHASVREHEETYSRAQPQ
jgi:hypothetical protein